MDTNKIDLLEIIVSGAAGGTTVVAGTVRRLPSPPRDSSKSGLSVDYSRYVKRFGSALECGASYCKDLNYRYANDNVIFLEICPYFSKKIIFIIKIFIDNISDQMITTNYIFESDFGFFYLHFIKSCF